MPYINLRKSLTGRTVPNVRAFAAILLWAIPLTARADVVFTDIGNNVYNMNAGWIVGGVGAFVTSSAFTSPGNYDLTQVDVGAGIRAGNNSIILNLLDDNAGTPGKLLESWTLKNLPMFGTTDKILQTAKSVQPVTLIAGKQYWLQMEPGAANTSASWNYNDQPVRDAGGKIIGVVTGPVYNTGAGVVVLNKVDTLAAFDVLGTPPRMVPEPAFSLPIVAALVSLALWRKRRLGEGPPLRINRSGLRASPAAPKREKQPQLVLARDSPKRFAPETEPGSVSDPKWDNRNFRLD